MDTQDAYRPFTLDGPGVNVHFSQPTGTKGQNGDLPHASEDVIIGRADFRFAPVDLSNTRPDLAGPSLYGVTIP